MVINIKLRATRYGLFFLSASDNLTDKVNRATLANQHQERD
ncbi:MAG: hypothetical protein ACPL0B_01710 [Anaerolineales bacterium]